MSEPPFLTIDEVLRLHAVQVARYGGSADLRDIGLLESALAMPAASFDGRYLHGTVFEMAAAYVFHLVQNHPFVDGNKRVGLAAALAFLSFHDLKVSTSEDELVDLVVGVASGRVSKAQVAVFFERNAVARQR